MFTVLHTILLQAQTPAGGEESPVGGGQMQLIFFGGLILVMYFFMIRPQQKRQKEAKKFQEGIAKGESVVTIGGIHGKVVEADDNTVILDVDRGTKLTFERSSISAENTKKAQGK